MQIKNIIHQFVKQSIGNYTNIETLGGDASERKYYRIHTLYNSFILCEDPDFIDCGIPQNYPYFVVYNLFNKNDIPVPEVHHINCDNGLYLLQDMGKKLLDNEYNSLSIQEKKRIYSTLIEILVKIQIIEHNGNIPPFQLSFDTKKLMYEFDFFICHAMLKYFNSKITGNELKNLRNEFIKISNVLYKPELFVLNHRDFHSKNVLLHDNTPFNRFSGCKARTASIRSGITSQRFLYTN